MHLPKGQGNSRKRCKVSHPKSSTEQKGKRHREKKIASQPHESPKQRTGRHEGGRTRGSDIDREVKYVFNLHKRKRGNAGARRKEEKKIHTN